MTEQEKLKEFNFFNKTVNSTTKFVDKQPFHKLAFLGIVTSISFVILLQGTSYLQGVLHKHELLNEQQELLNKKHIAEQLRYKQELQREQTQIDIANSKLAYEKIKQISPEDFAKFITYLEKNADLYDSRINLLIKSIITAESMANQTLDSAQTSENLENWLSWYKKSFEVKIIQSNNIYLSILNGKTNISARKINQLFNDYNLSLSGIFATDTNLEKVLHQVEYTDEQGNKNYNKKNHVFEQMTALKDAATTSIKPKMN
jgi:hypothetical protein